MAIEIVGKSGNTVGERQPQPVQPRPAAAGGEALPASGNDVPPRAEVPAVDISRAITNLNQFLKDSQRNIVFQLDQSSGRTVITIVNPNTGEIVRQIPPEEVLNAARTLRDAGILLSARA